MKVGRKIIRLESVDSTNNYTANLIKGKEIDHGTVIMADEQFAGRGQRGAQWLANPGENLTFSVFLDNVNVSVDKQFYLTKIISISLVKMLANFGLSAQVKWPNDILINGKKIAGVLIENQVQGNKVVKSIVGIGFNVNQTDFDDLKATSLFLQDGVRRNIQDVLFSFIACFNDTWLNPTTENLKTIDAVYLNKLFRYNHTAAFYKQGKIFLGKIKGVDALGKLIVELDGREETFDLKEIQFKL